MSSSNRLGGLTWKELGRRSWKQFRFEHVKDQSATLSFYFLLAIFPLLLILIDFLGLLSQSGPVLQQSMHKYLARLAPSAASGLVDNTISEVTHGFGAITFSIQLLFAWLPASQGVMAVIDGLNRAYGVTDSRKWWRKYLAACGLTVLSLLLLATGLLILIFGGYASGILGNISGHRSMVSGIWKVMDWAIFIGLVFFAFNVLYIYGPAVKHRRWRWFMPGTVVGVSIWLFVSFAFKVYLHYLDYYSHTYGSIGAVIILILWFFFLGISILSGAVVNSEIEKAAGTLRGVE